MENISALDIETFALIVASLGVFLNLLLWITTVRSLREIRRQNDNIARSIKNETITRITESHQNIFLSLLSDTKLLSVLTKGMEKTTVFREQMIGTLLINHCAAIHLYSTQNTLDPDDWVGMQNDIIDLFDWPIVKNRWPQVRTFYSREFQEFIETLVVKGRVSIKKGIQL